MGKEIKAFIFDLDGVITDTAEYHFMSWKQLCIELGFHFTREDNERLKGVSRLKSLEIILEINNAINTYTEEEKLRLAERKNKIYVELINKITPKDTLPGIRELLCDIKKNSIKTAIASVSKNAFTVIDRLGMNNDFNYIVDAKLVKNSKPAPDVFIAASDALHISPEYCIGIEDAEAGITAIKAAGMFAVGVGTKSKMHGADLIVGSTAELKFGKIKDEFLKYNK